MNTNPGPVWRPDARFLHLSSIDGVVVDLRYACADNFAGRNLYGNVDYAWLHASAAQGLRQAVAGLRVRAPGVRLKVLDALRPQHVQEQMWAALQGTELQRYLAHPERGSMHSFGMAVDLCLVDAGGVELDMGTPFDYMGELAHPALESTHFAHGLLSAEQLANRRLLRDTMLGAGFAGIDSEWWHFDFGDRARVRRDFERVP